MTVFMTLYFVPLPHSAWSCLQHMGVYHSISGPCICCVWKLFSLQLGMTLWFPLPRASSSTRNDWHSHCLPPCITKQSKNLKMHQQNVVLHSKINQTWPMFNSDKVNAPLSFLWLSVIQTIASFGICVLKHE